MEEFTQNAAAGNVYIFNVSALYLQVSTNGMTIAAGPIPGWSPSGAAKYQPYGQAVPRTLNASDGPGKFFNGTNALTLSTDYGLYAANVGIDGSQIPLNQDLLLFVQSNQWQLVDQYGAAFSSGTVFRQGVESPN